MPIEAIIFDLDGLMVDSEPIALEVWREVLEPFGVELSPEVHSRVIGFEPSRGAGIMIDEFRLPITVEELLEIYWEYRTTIMEHRIEPQPGLLDLMDFFEREGYRLGVASNSPSFYVKRILAAINIDGRLVCAVGSDEVRFGKPAPDVYLAAASRLEVSPENCLAIEDSPAGVIAAHAAGMRCIAIPNPALKNGDFGQADTVLDSLTGLCGYLTNSVGSA